MKLVFTVVVHPFTFLLLQYGVSSHENNGIRGEGSPLRMLHRELTDDYVPGRPVLDPTEVLNVGVYFSLFQIIDLDGKSEVLSSTGEIQLIWKDDYLSWNKTKHPQVPSIILSTDDVWLPDIYIANSAAETRKLMWYEKEHVMVMPTGNVLWKINSDFTTTCSLDMSMFPYDTQTCDIMVAMQVHTNKSVSLSISNKKKIYLDQYATNGEWDIEDTNAETGVMSIDRGNRVLSYSFSRFTVMLKRKAMYYQITILIPCMMLSFMTLLVFCVPPEAGEKISLSITLLLSFTVFMLMVSDYIPRTSTYVVVLSVYFLTTMTVSMLSLIAAICVLICHHQNPEYPVPFWIQILINLFGPAHQKVTRKVSECDERSKSMKEVDARQNMDLGVQERVCETLEAILNEMRDTNKTRQEPPTANKWHVAAKVLDKVLFWLMAVIVIFINIILQIYITT